uniref:Jacalin-type lectin domain-containing protein n=1 Tax=Leersia perrieri TaxID=77586 RepID=A0A0D9W1X3_9ORYZ
MEMEQRRFSWLAVLIIVIVSISVYTSAFLGGVALGRALERNKSPAAFNTAVDDDTHGRSSSVVKKVGPWGGSGGWHDFGLRGFTVPRRLNSITLYHSNNGTIHSLSFDYYIRHKLVQNGPWGQPQSFDSVAVGETVTAVMGTIGHFRDVIEPVITSLTFRTNTGGTYGPYGGSGEHGTRFSMLADKGCIVVGFCGRAGWLVDSIGIYHRKKARH